jgi:chromosome segregation ATPase
MYEGRSLVPQFPIPVALPDFSRTHVASVAEVFPEAKPPAPRLIERLNNARLKMHGETVARANELAIRYLDLEKQIEAFLTEHKSRRLSELEAKRGALWAECRKIEDAIGAHVQEVGRLNTSLNNQAHVVSEWRAKVQEAAQPPFATRFPNQAEVQTWNGRLAAARIELAKAISGQQETDSALRSRRIGHETTVRELASKVDELRAADSELKALQQT